jgi:hypothetical protein
MFTAVILMGEGEEGDYKVNLRTLSERFRIQKMTRRGLNIPAPHFEHRVAPSETNMLAALRVALPASHSLHETVELGL